MTDPGDVLVAIMNNRHDWGYAIDDHWYRIPVTSVERFLKHRWPPRWLAFYHTKDFGEEAYSVRYVGRVIDIRRRTRRELFPNEEDNPKSNRPYYQLRLASLDPLPRPIPSPRWRRITFIPTTWAKLETATEINDLYDDSPLEDTLWTALKPYDLPLIRQEWVEIGPARYVLDFAIYCAKAKLAIETDGDTWHHNPEAADKDNLRDNDLKADGWQVLHFNTRRIMEETATYCVPTILETIETLGGTDDGTFVPRRIDPDADSPRQMGLFD
jgi:very-short-patch-repair endonuclease